MKKLFSILVTFVLFMLCPYSYASPCPQPKANTDVEIKLPGFEWYVDYNEAIEEAIKAGFSRPHADFSWNGGCYTPHWSIYMGMANSFAGSEVNCGGTISFDGPNIAGYELRELILYCIYTPNIGKSENYMDEGAIQYYMGEYNIKAEDKETIFHDLEAKLKTIYGNEPYTYKDDVIMSSYWINSDGATVGVKCNMSRDVSIIYCAPESEKALVEAEAWEKVLEKQYAQEQVENAAGDMSGL